MEQAVSFGEHGQQGIGRMTGASVLARMVSFQRALLLAVAFEDSGIQVQAVTVAALRQPLHRPLGQRVEETMHVAHVKTTEEIADGVVNGKAGDAQHGVQGAIVAQPVGVSKTSGSRQHGHEKRGEGRGGIDLVGGLPLDRHVLPNLFNQSQLVKEGYKNRSPAQRGHGTLRLAQNQPLVRQSGAASTPD